MYRNWCRNYIELGDTHQITIHVVSQTFWMQWSKVLQLQGLKAEIARDVIKAVNRPISQIPQCIGAVSHNAPFCNRNVHISVTKWCIVGYLFDALWDLWDGSIRLPCDAWFPMGCDKAMMLSPCLSNIFTPLHANFFSRNINMYMQFLSLYHTDMTQVVETLSRGRQGPTYFTWSISWVLMAWPCKEPGHQ